MSCDGKLLPKLLMAQLFCKSAPNLHHNRIGLHSSEYEAARLAYESKTETCLRRLKLKQLDMLYAAAVSTSCKENAAAKPSKHICATLVWPHYPGLLLMVQFICKPAPDLHHNRIVLDSSEYEAARLAYESKTETCL